MYFLSKFLLFIIFDCKSLEIKVPVPVNGSKICISLSFKLLIIASVKSITSEQDTEITYYYGQELSGTFTTITDYENKVNSVTKEQIVEIANSVSINTIYFLKD